jgi:predicted CXXCH cytochrome family protein
VNRISLTFATLLASVLIVASLAIAQTTPGPAPTTDVLGVHDLSAGTSPLRGANANACIYCHTPHGGLSTTALWNQTLSTKQYTLNPGTTGNPVTPTSVGPASMLCLSCHDGTVAVGQTVGLGTIKTTGTIPAMGTNLEGSHPFSILPQIKDAPTLVSSLVASHTSRDATVKLIANNIECSTCHDVHNQYNDRRATKFLVRDNTSSALCFACHDVGARTVNSRDNVLTAWPSSAHAKSTLQLAPKAGFPSYTNIGEVACASCHASHGALGTALMRKNPNRPANIDDTSQACVTCHDGSDNVAQPLLNVLSDMNGPGQIAHPFGEVDNTHLMTEPVVLDRNRHATCADCHAPHAAQPTTTFPATAALRPSQIGVTGVSSTGTVANIATSQYENCLRCHGASDKKQSLALYGYMPARAQFAGDALDVSLQFAHGAPSSHPVMRDATNLARLSLLKSVWNVGFKIQGRPMSNRTLCTDCHNSDNNREFGGTGPNGPHGSKNDHILERQYIMSQLAPGDVPGGKIVNLNTSPILDPVPASPYALCAKCHDLKYIASGASWAEHNRHITDGFSCSVCHSAHGVQAATAGVTGQGLVSFDRNVVGQYNGLPVSYAGGATCTLTCHTHDHKGP